MSKLLCALLPNSLPRSVVRNLPIVVLARNWDLFNSVKKGTYLVQLLHYPFKLVSIVRQYKFWKNILLCTTTLVLSWNKVNESLRLIVFKDLLDNGGKMLEEFNFEEVNKSRKLFFNKLTILLQVLTYNFLQWVRFERVGTAVYF